MSSEKRYYRLGLFVLLGIALIVAGVIIFGAGIFFQPVMEVETSVTESVQGLDVGADVRFQGVQMGRLKRVELGASLTSDGDEKTRHELARYVILTMELFTDRMPDRKDMSKKEQIENAVKFGLRVRMAKGGLTGPNYLEILMANPDQNPPLTLPFTPRYTYIPSMPSFAATVTSGIEALAQDLREMNLGETMQNANKLLTEMRQTIADLKAKTVGDHLVATMDQAQASATRVRQILEGPEVDAIIKNASGASSGANKLLNSEDIKKFLAHLPQISEQLKSTTDRLDAIAHDPAIDKTLQGTANIGPAVADLRRVMRELSSLLTSQRNQIDSVIANMQRTTENTATLTEDAAANPARLLFGNPPPKTVPK